ncbi:putative potassium transporter 12 [Silene latifolia]|uniref:putative potassium transporter 12 n=1 Tax=Silene latifolia TaxID=37657 RepID=UPI003D76A9EB
MKGIEEEEEEEKGSLRWVGSGGSGTSSRWVDGSEVDSQDWSQMEEEDELRNRFSIRRRLIKKPKRADSFDVEAMEITAAHAHHNNNKETCGWHTLALAFQTLGVVYGDLGTSPLYVFTDVFSKVSITSDVDVLGALSVVLYTIALVPLTKYVFLVLKANDNGEGGTFALYSLISRYANVNMLPNRQPADERISSYRLKLPTPELERALNIKELLEKKSSLKAILLFVVLTGTSLIIGDGILTPAMSVMSAVSGLQGEINGFDSNAVVIVSMIILVGLFSIQSFGTSKVGISFAPVLALWFVCLASIGVYNMCRHGIFVVKALNPAYIYLFFIKNGKQAWSALGGCVLCITGAEAMFADLGHFSVRSIQIAFTSVVFPCLLLAYMGQGAYLIKYPTSADRIFYSCVPGGFFWPVFVIATLAAVIASQAMISATFSVIKQSMSLGCFPRLKIVHTSKTLMGQIYIPVINWFLMVMCLIVVASFRSTTNIANAYGIAEVGVMLVSTALVTLVMLLIWQTNLFLALAFPIVFGAIELIYLSAVLSKVLEGGWLPLAFAAFLLLVMYTWNYGSVLKYRSEVRNKLSVEVMDDLGSTLGTVRVPGIGLMYNELVLGVPSILGQFLLSLPGIHSTIIFVCIKYVPVPVVPQEERFLFRRICPKDYHMFRCIARYGYKDVRKEDHHLFEQLLIDSLKKFLKSEAIDLALEASVDDDLDDCVSVRSRESGPSNSVADDLLTPLMQNPKFEESNEELLPSSVMSSEDDPSVEYELSALREAIDSGFTYLLGDADVRAKKESWFLKKLVINYFYAFLRRNCRRGAAVLRVPHMNVIEVGMTYMV